MQKEIKKDAIKKYQTHGKDTGSTQVQVAILTEKISSLTEHLKVHKKDVHSRRGLIGMVGQRRKLLRYLKMKNPTEYMKLVSALKIRH